MTDTDLAEGPVPAVTTGWIRTTTLQQLHDETGRLLASGMPPKSTVTPDSVDEDDGPQDILVVVTPPKPTTLDLLREVAAHAPYRTARPDELVQVVVASIVDDYDTVLLPRGQLIAALNAAPLLLRLVDRYDHIHDDVRWAQAYALIRDIVAELRGAR